MPDDYFYQSAAVSLNETSDACHCPFTLCLNNQVMFFSLVKKIDALGLVYFRMESPNRRPSGVLRREANL